MPKLLEQVRNLIRTRHYSISTEQAYLNWIRQFILFHGKRHPAVESAPAQRRANARLFKIKVGCQKTSGTGSRALSGRLFPDVTLSSLSQPGFSRQGV